MKSLNQILAFYHLWSERIQKIPGIRGKLSTTLSFFRGTVLSLRFKKRAFIDARGKVRIRQERGGFIEVDDFVSFDPEALLSVSSSNARHPAQLSIGAMSHIGSKTEIHCGEKVIIGKHVLIGWDCVIMDRDYHPLPGATTEKTAPIVIEDNAWIGCRSIVLKGVTIGHDAVVGAGSVVTKDVEPCTIVVGNPIRVVKKGLPTQRLPIRMQDFVFER